MIPSKRARVNENSPPPVKDKADEVEDEEDYEEEDEEDEAAVEEAEEEEDEAMVVDEAEEAMAMESARDMLKCALSLTEKVDLHHLASLLETEGKRLDSPKARADAAMLKKMYKAAVKSNGVLKVNYISDAALGGRGYASGTPSLQHLPNKWRPIVSVPCWDLDLVNCHPTLAYVMCTHWHIDCPILESWVTERDSWATEDMPIKTLKKSFSAILNGSQQAVAHPKLDSWRTERNAIIPELLKHYEHVRSLVLGTTRKATGERRSERAVLSFVLQQEELRIVIKAILHVREQFAAHVNGYMYDGFMVAKEGVPDPQTLLESLNACVAADGVKFAIKPFEPPDGWEPIPVQALPLKLSKPDEITSDIAAAQEVLKAFPGCVRKDGDIIRVFSWDNGLWSRKSGESAFKALCHKALGERSWRYGLMNAGSMAAWNVVGALLPDDSAFFEAARALTVGKLLGTNGVWDKLAPDTQGMGKLVDFNPAWSFGAAGLFPFPDKEPPNVVFVNNFLWGEPFPVESAPGVADWLRQKQTRSMFGIKRMGTEEFIMEEGPGSGGKSMRAKLFEVTFGRVLCPTILGRDLLVSKFPNPGAPSAHGIQLRDARLTFVSEPVRDGVLDMNLIKQSTGGDSLGLRGMRGDVTPFFTQSSWHFLCNFRVKLSECEADFMNRRARYVQSNVQYSFQIDEDDPTNQLFKADHSKVELAHESQLALLWLLCKEPLWSEADVKSKLPKSIKDFSDEVIAGQDEYRAAFDKEYERDATGRTTSADIIDTLQRVHPDLKMDPRVVRAKMVSWGFKPPKALRLTGAAKVANGYEGVAKRKCEDVGAGSG